MTFSSRGILFLLFLFNTFYHIAVSLDFITSCDISTGELQKFIQNATSSICGQPYALDLVNTVLLSHFENPNPTHAVVMSWHGETGVGKSSVASLLQKHFTTVTFHGLDAHTSESFYTTVQTGIIRCPRTIFIFDDADIMPPSQINQLLTFLDGSNRYFARMATFIFIMNTGADQIRDALRGPVEKPYGGFYPEDYFLHENRLVIDYDSNISTEEANIIWDKRVELQNELLNEMNKSTQASEIHLQHSSPNPNPNLNSSFNSSFMNMIVLKGLISHVVPFLPITVKEAECCAAIQLRLLRSELTTLNRKKLHVPLTSISFQWFGAEPRHVGFHDFNWHDGFPITLAKKAPQTDDGFLIDGCRGIQASVIRDISIPISTFANKRMMEKEKKIQLEELEQQRREREQKAKSFWSIPSFFKIKKKPEVGCYDTSIFISKDGRPRFTRTQAQSKFPDEL